MESVSAPFEVEEARSVRFAFLDYLIGSGRPVVVLRASNLVDEHKGDVVVVYRAGFMGKWLEAIMVVGTIAVIAALLFVASRLRLSIAPDRKVKQT